MGAPGNPGAGAPLPELQGQGWAGFHQQREDIICMLSDYTANMGVVSLERAVFESRSLRTG